MKRSFGLMLAWLFLCALALPAAAGVQSPCDNPIILPGPKVQVFILPYEAQGRLTPRGHELATILQRHVLFAALKYPSIAVEELTGESKLCTPEKIMARIGGKLQDGQAAIFLWGRLFEQGDAIRMQSTVAFTMHGSADKLQWSLGGDAANDASASVPSDPVLFAARQIPLDLLQALEPAYREARRFHKAPDASSSFFDLPDSPEARFGYEVLETRDDWMHIRLIPGGDDGWVPAHALASADNLKGSFPELYFVDGLIGYHQLWGVGSRPAATNPRRMLELTRTSFDRYIQQAAGRAESEARALAMILKGNATLRAAGPGAWSTETLQQAQALYRDGQELAPTSTTASNFFLACSSALCARGTCGGGSDQLHEQYLRAIARDPTSTELVTNLDRFYGAAQSGRIRLSVPADQIAEQRARTSAVQREMH
ncbi:MAG TPA: hypothetical protein VJS12_03600 [Steroidobacteraceae bacterium]|nr:hypothetical protein [Steroidobacteraceae bacterium]